MKQPVQKKRKREHRGSAMVEFALVVPLFFLIIFALVNFSIVFAGYCQMAYASQLAVRYATVHGASSPYTCSSATLTALVAPYLWAAQKNSSTVTVTWNPDNSTGSTVIVAISLTYRTGIPFSTLNTVKVGTKAQGTILY